MLAVQPNELPASPLTQCSDCAAFIIGISFAFYISRHLEPHISPALSEMQLHPYIHTPINSVLEEYVLCLVKC